MSIDLKSIKKKKELYHKLWQKSIFTDLILSQKLEEQFCIFHYTGKYNNSVVDVFN